MAFAVGVTIFALGILIAVCLHEAGHMGTAKAFGMKVTRYFVGFGPTLFSFRRGETEYGVKAIPLGGFVKIVGMTPQDDDVKPEDESRAMWRFPVWKRTVVMSAGSITHFILAFIVLWSVFVIVGLPDGSKMDQVPVRVGGVQPCLAPEWEFDKATNAAKACDPATDPRSPAAQAGLQPGDVITVLGGRQVPNYPAMREALLEVGGQRVDLTYSRNGTESTVAVDVPVVERVKSDVAKPGTEITDADIEKSGMLGIGVDLQSDLPIVRAGPFDGVGKTFNAIGLLFERTFESFKQMPEKIPNLVGAILGEERDPETPVSVVGASRIGGELFERQMWVEMLILFATLNLFFGVFNLFPLLPMDGGHIAISWFERVRSWLAARRGRPDPGRVDYYKLTPITLGVIGVLGLFVLLTVTADIVNPIQLPDR
jgi:membrane-associated protease RseP (regulator of RpoE activity)